MLRRREVRSAYTDKPICLAATITQVLHHRRSCHACVIVKLMNAIMRITKLMSILKRDKTFTQPVNWTAAFMAAFHVGAIAALFFFTWRALAVAVLLWWVAGSLGIGMGYHRLLTATRVQNGSSTS